MEEGGTATVEQALGKRLQLARQKAGLTQQELCSQANLSYSTLAKIERGAIKAPSIFTIQSIAGALQTSLDALIGVSSTAQGGSTNKRVSQTGVRFVYFDLNGCLVRFLGSGFTQLAQDSGASIDIVESVFWQYNAPVCRGDVSVDELNQAWAERLGIRVDWLKYYLSAIEAMPGMTELAEWVAGQYHSGILSNTMPGFIAALQAGNRLPTVQFDAIVDSSQVHALKPEPEIYQIALQKAGVAAEEILLIDDDRPNLAAAQAAGWHTIWFDSYHPEESIESIRAALQPAE